jgi:pentatricopeptide repeat protein
MGVTHKFIITTCGKRKNFDCVIQVLEEMKLCYSGFGGNEAVWNLGDKHI